MSSNQSASPVAVVRRILCALVPACMAAAPMPTPTPAQIDYDRERQTIVWRGDFQATDLERFERVVGPDDKVRELEIHDSHGGNYPVALSMAKFVEERHVAVSASGPCVSACSMIFLSAATRRLLPGLERPTYLHIHGAYDANGAFVTRFRDAELSELKTNTGNRFPADLYLRARFVRRPRGGLYIYREPIAVPSGPASVLFCEGVEWSIPWDCAPVPGATARSLGIES